MKIIPISVNIPPPPSISVKMEEIPVHENSYYSWNVRCSFFYNAHKWKINFITLLAISAIITISISISDTSSSSTDTGLNPCIKYKDDDYASEVSVKCLQKLWDLSGCITKGKGTVPDNYKGWWLQSPSGGKTVLCIPPNTNERCGAGNFATIRNSIYICILDYKGY